MPQVRVWVYLALFFALALLLVASHEFNWHGLAGNAAISLLILPYGWLVWKLMRHNWLLLTGLMLALALMMIYWTAALAGNDSWLDLLLLPLLVVIIGGVYLGTSCLADIGHCRTTERLPIERSRNADACNGHSVSAGHRRRSRRS